MSIKIVKTQYNYYGLVNDKRKYRKVYIYVISHEYFTRDAYIYI